MTSNPSTNFGRKIRTEDLPPHPIEADSAFRDYVSRPGIRNPSALRRGLSRFLREMAPVALNSVTVAHINPAIERLSAKGYNPSYVDKLYRGMSAFFQWCRDFGKVDSNPFKATKPPRPDGVFIPTIIPETDLSELHNHIMSRGVADEIVLWGALRMGARLSEPCMLTVGDVKNGRGITEVIADRRIILRTKTQGRPAVQPRFALQAIEFLLNKHGDCAPETPFLYLNGIPLTVRDNALSKMVQNIEPRALVARQWLEKMQLEIWNEYRWTPKEFRSTFISNELIKNPNSILSVAKQCGNSVAIIQKHYLSFILTPEFSTGE